MNAVLQDPPEGRRPAAPETERQPSGSAPPSDPLLSLATPPEGAGGQQALGELAELQRFANAGRLAASVSHELRNALAAAHANLAFLEDALAEKGLPALAEAAQDARASIERALGATKSVLNLVRGRASCVGPMQASESINRALQAVASRLGGNVRLELDLAPVPTVEVDEGALHQALVNILINAVEAAPSGRACLRVSVQLIGGWVRVSVADNGPGVAAEIRERLFQPQVTTKAERGGAGLGLSISRALVRSFGGDLVAGEGPLGGAEFAILLRVVA